jgi:general secretion pathway protein G
VTEGDDEGYTLTEMLVVIAIISLLAAVLTPMLAGQLGRARARAARLQVDNVATTLEMFRNDVGRYPTAGEGLQALIVPPKDTEGWLGPYVRDPKGLLDPWGHALVYAPGSEGQEARVKSLGADGKPGGSGVAADVESR